MGNVKLYLAGSSGLYYAQFSSTTSKEYPPDYFSQYRVTVDGEYPGWNWKTTWNLDRCVPLCEYRAEVLALRAEQLADKKQKENLEKLWQGIETVATLASIVFPAIRLGVTSLRWVALMEELSTVVSVIEKGSKIAKGLTSDGKDLAEVLACVFLDSVTGELAKQTFLAGVTAAMPQHTGYYVAKQTKDAASNVYEIFSGQVQLATSAKWKQSLPERVDADAILEDIYRFRLKADPALRNAVAARLEGKLRYADEYHEYLLGKRAKPFPAYEVLPLDSCRCKWCTPPATRSKTLSGQTSSGAITTYPGGF